MKPLVVTGAACLALGLVLGIAGLVKVGEKPAKLSWSDPEVKPALMSLGYKVYGNPKVEYGRHYLSKIVFRNEGDHPVTDFSISFRLGELIPEWTEPETLSSIPAGFTFVHLFHPKLPSSISKMRNSSQASLQIRMRWKEEGKAREQVLARDVTVRGVNELAYCDKPKGEVQGWFDRFNASSFAIAMVTPNDPVVTLYTAEITRLAGGTTAGVSGGGQEILRLCKVTYEYMQRSGLHYTGASGIPSDTDDIWTYVQTVRLPRDVILNNQGLCIELALLWCSLLEHMGLQSALVMVPGHAFVVAYSEAQGVPLMQGLPIECTAITPRAVGRDAEVSFEDAVKMAAQTVQRQMQDGRIFFLPVRTIQAMGFTPPELPDVDAAAVSALLAKRMARVAAAEAAAPAPIGPAPIPSSPIPPQGAGQTWQHPQGLVSVIVPESLTAMNQGALPPYFVHSVADPSTSLGLDVIQVRESRDPRDAIQRVASAFAQMGVQLQLSQIQPQAGGVSMLSGAVYSQNGSVQWIALAKATQGGVVMVSVGANAMAFPSLGSQVQQILGSVRFR